MDSLKGTAWDPRSFFHQVNLHWFLQPEVVGIYLPSTGTLHWGAWYGAGIPHCQDIPPEFLSTTRGWGTSMFLVCAPPTSLDGCGFFNSIVVRLPFNFISDSSEWWLFYILVVILMWLCEEASCVHLCHHLDQSFPLGIFKQHLKYNYLLVNQINHLKIWSSYYQKNTCAPIHFSKLDLDIEKKTYTVIFELWNWQEVHKVLGFLTWRILILKNMHVQSIVHKDKWTFSFNNGSNRNL